MSAGQAPEYALGGSDHERQRLVQQAAILEAISERILRAAGLMPGMRVLDVGCGAGDLSLLAARIVGASGTVVGLDRDAGVIAFAQERSLRIGAKNMIFLREGLDSARFSEPFDAVVGRYVLIHQPDPTAAVRQAAGFARSKGRVVFHEPDLTNVGHSWPDAPQFRRSMEWVLETFRRTGAHVDMGMRLYRTFLDAGLHNVHVMSELPADGRSGSLIYEWFASTVRSLLPKMEQLGVATAQEVQPETLAQRIEAEAVATASQLCGPLQCGAWANTA